MIAKKIVKNPAIKGSFNGLVNYLTNDKSIDERVGTITVTNCMSDDFEAAKLEIEATQMRNTKAQKSKTLHLLLSFSKNEKPTQEDLKKIEDEFCNALGLKGHQRISVQHGDTDNFHLHIAVNRVNPKTYKVVDKKGDFKIMAEIAKKVEKEFNLTETNHESQKRASQNRADDLEAQTGIKSLLSMVRDLKSKIDEAKSWSDLHEILAKEGIELRKKGRGLIFSSKGKNVKASDVSRDYSLNSLEKKFGTFIGIDNDIKNKYKKELEQGTKIKLVNEQLAKEYQDFIAQKGKINVKERIKDVVKDNKLTTDILLSFAEDEVTRKLLMWLMEESIDNDIKNVIKEKAEDKEKFRNFKVYLKEKRKKSLKNKKTTRNLTINKTSKVKDVIQVIYAKLERLKINEQRIRRIASWLANQFKLRIAKLKSVPAREVIARKRMYELRTCGLENGKHESELLLQSHVSDKLRTKSNERSDSNDLRRKSTKR